MKSFWIAKIIKGIFFAIFATFLLGYVVMGLWNWLMPVLFSLPLITWWQAIGLFLLSKIFFGFGFRGGWGNHHGRYQQWRQKMQDRWSTMSPEEKEQWKKQWKSRCGGAHWSDFAKTDEEDSTPPKTKDFV